MENEPQFTRKTILVASDLIADHPAMSTHWAFGDFILCLGADDAVPTDRSEGFLGDKWHRLKKHLVAHRSARTPDDEFMWNAVVRKAASLPGSYEDMTFVRALARDGFSVTEQGEIRRMLPDIGDIPAADNEVHALLEELGLTVTKGHLEHAIDLHGRGEWEPANGELRKVIENIFDEAARKLDPVHAAAQKTSENRRQLLADLDPPFLIEGLGEWGNGGKNFVNGVFKRLHPGAHAGMSEDDDCTFRLHLVLVVARLFLRRLKSRLQQN